MRRRSWHHGTRAENRRLSQGERCGAEMTAPKDLSGNVSACNAHALPLVTAGRPWIGLCNYVDRIDCKKKIEIDNHYFYCKNRPTLKIVDSILVQTTERFSNILRKWILSSYPGLQCFHNRVYNIDRVVMMMSFICSCRNKKIGAELYVYLCNNL